jgi:hypothetical protein
MMYYDDQILKQDLRTQEDFHKMAYIRQETIMENLVVLRHKIIDIINELNDDECSVLYLLAFKMEAGKQKYGPLDIESDKRNLNKEITEELIDALNYCAMKLIKESK